MMASLVGSLLLVFLLGCARHYDTTELLQRYIQAANRHDMPALRGMLAEDIVWVLSSDTLIGKDAVLAPHEFDAGAKTRLTVQSSVVQGDTAELAIEEANAYMDTLGMPPVVHYARFIFHNGLLARIGTIRPRLTPPATDSIDQRWNAWIESAHPEAWAQIIKPDGHINFGRKTGELLVRLAHEWKHGPAK